MKQATSLFHHPLFLPLSIFILWLFQVSGIIGISLGYQDWFISKTPLNLYIVIVLLCLNFPINSIKKTALFTFVFLAGMLVEWIGVHYDFLFGPYSYGTTLGIKLDDVPLLIGLNWAMLVFVTGTIANQLADQTFIRILIGSSLMVLLDFFIEAHAPIFDYWTFENGIAPLKNYIAWFVIAAVLHFVFQKNKMDGNRMFAWHLYLSQLVFFVWFWCRL